jgi:hypothetical protein
MSKCLVVLTFTEVESFSNGEKYDKRQHLGIALIKEDKSSNEIINLMRVGYPEQFVEEIYGVNSMLEQLPMLGVEVVYEEITKDMANRLLDEAKKLKIIYKKKVVTLAKFLNSRCKDYEVENTYNALVNYSSIN